MWLVLKTFLSSIAILVFLLLTVLHTYNVLTGVRTGWLYGVAGSKGISISKNYLLFLLTICANAVFACGYAGCIWMLIRK